ncbi:pantoate--beta-alanine ligase [Nocardia sp. NPDC058518]|uniref:pantoate--beta-alanine ligase n=1 Tax=Nocardia sp. NPDC058518 TaxID=3346534 RepID=UPI003654D1B0
MVGSTPTVQHDPSTVAAISADLRDAGRRVALVPTMGALHEGHLALVEHARADHDDIIVSIFVNPLQFGAGEDFDRYPRTLESDVRLLSEVGVELVFAPSAAAMYPDGRRTTLVPGPAGADLDAVTRPALWTGMLTVVAKLLQITRPTSAFFGEKDFQQLVLIQQMVRDLNFDIDIVGVPTVREHDGLAMSSRNRFLSAAERKTAAVLSTALMDGVRAQRDGVDAILKAAGAVLDAVVEIDVEYLEVRDDELGPAPDAGPARLLVAGRVGSTRLTDNMALKIGEREQGE